ncbi:MAG: PAS domain S-box protein, partial [bacterium]|nr:PAS domain S-box protein [bacterium]
MKDDEKTKEQLIDELTNLRQQVNQLKKATEKEQGKSFDEFKAIFENISDGIVLLTATGKVLKVNQRILEVGGYSKKEIIGKRFIYLKMFPLKCRLQMAARFGKEMAGIKTPPIEVEVYTKTGEKLDIEIYGSVFKMGGRKKVSVAILRDISERKKAEEKLKEYSNHLEQEVKDRTLELRNANQKLRREIKKHRQAEKNMEVLFEFAPDCYYINDLKGHFINGNKAAEELIGYPREEMIGKSFLKLKLLHPKDIPRAASRLAQNLIGRATGPDEFRIIRKDGREIIIETRAHPINIEGKSMVLGIARDITARKQQEKELEDYRLHLEEMVEKRSAQLSEANEKLVLSEKMDAIGQLAGGVAHDLNNILTAMVSYPDLVLMKLPEDSPVRNQILVVKQAGLKAAAIVEDLLTLARRGVRMSEVLNLNDLVSEYLVSPEHKQLQSSHPHVKISPHLDNDLFNIEGSAIHIGKSIMNLVTNASEAAPVKGSIKLSTANLYVDKPVKCFNSNIKKGNYVVLKVSDNGIGIAP